MESKLAIEGNGCLQSGVPFKIDATDTMLTGIIYKRFTQHPADAPALCFGSDGHLGQFMALLLRMADERTASHDLILFIDGQEYLSSVSNNIVNMSKRFLIGWFDASKTLDPLTVQTDEILFVFGLILHYLYGV